MERMQDHVNSNQRRRTYSPGEARFITQVRMEELLAGEQPYLYALNNPTTYTDPSGNAPNNWQSVWVNNNLGMINKCIGQGMQNSNCKGLNKQTVSHMMQCIIGCETSDLPSNTNIMWPDSQRNPKGHPNWDIGPCRISQRDWDDGFPKYPYPGWNTDPCSNIKNGIALLCYGIKTRTGGSYTTLPYDWNQDQSCFSGCMKRPSLKSPVKAG